MGGSDLGVGDGVGLGVGVDVRVEVGEGVNVAVHAGGKVGIAEVGTDEPGAGLTSETGVPVEGATTGGGMGFCNLRGFIRITKIPITTTPARVASKAVRRFTRREALMSLVPCSRNHPLHRLAIATTALIHRPATSPPHMSINARMPIGEPLQNMIVQMTKTVP